MSVKRRLRLLGMFCNSGKGLSMEVQNDIRIGNSGDALALLDQILEGKEFLSDSVKAILEALKDAIQRGILQ